MKLFLALVLLAGANAANENRVALETDVTPYLPPGWSKAGLSASLNDPKIELTFAVKQNNTKALLHQLEQTSDPGAKTSQKPTHSVVPHHLTPSG